MTTAEVAPAGRPGWDRKLERVMPKLLDTIADHYLRPHGGALRRGPTMGREGAVQAGGIEPDAKARKGRPQPPRLSLRSTLRALGLI